MNAVFLFFSRWPLPLLHAVGVVLGWAAWLASPSYRRRWLDHSRLAEVRGWARWRSVGEAGKLVAELPRLWLGAPVRVEWEGAQLIDAAHAAGQGMVFLTPHLGCFEITAQAYAERYGGMHRGLAGRPMTVLYRPPRQAALREVVERARQRPGLATAPTTLAGVRQLVGALRRGEAVGLLPDQVPPKGLGVFAPFFGRAAYTMTLSARLARTPGCIVLLAWGERLAWGRGYVVHVRALPDALPSDALGAAAAINAAMEALIGESPSQYLWGYARYKRPAGLAEEGA